jgi:hypothetical protein
MSTKGFADAVAELWSGLEIGPPPRPGPDGAVSMRVEGTTVSLLPSPDGTGLRALVRLGDLPEGPEGERLLGAVMRKALGLLAVNASCVRLEPGTRTVLVEGHAPATAPLQTRNKMIEAVLEAVELLQSDFSGPGAGTGARGPLGSGAADPASRDEVVVFRP